MERLLEKRTASALKEIFSNSGYIQGMQVRAKCQQEGLLRSILERIRQEFIDSGNPGGKGHAFRQAGAPAGILPAEGIDEKVGISWLEMQDDIGPSHSGRYW